uniref:Uncharacterized protein n=1 Tax=Lygus hesperus TaxID=30085 RepID=A0A0A9XK43_LYGHE
MQGFHSLDEYYELSDIYNSPRTASYRGNSLLKVVMVNDAGAEMQAAAKERVGSTSPLCHGSASSSQEEERLIGIDRTGYVARRRALDQSEDDPLTKSKLRGFYCVTVLLALYTTVYFTYLIMRPK